MTTVLRKVRGPYFDFLLTNGDHWERAGKNQRIKGIKSEFFHHPDSLRISDAIVGQVVECFSRANPIFNYYGPSEYRNSNLDELLHHLEEWISRCRSCKAAADFEHLLMPHFLEELKTLVGNWDQRWLTVRNEFAATIDKIVDKARQAKDERKTLLVLGI
jgi:hypothetical protein